MAYQKNTWVDGTSSVNAENMNHIENGVQDLSDVTSTYAKAKMTNDYTIQTASTIETLPIDSFYEKNGNLAISSNGVRIGAGITKIVVSGNIYYYTGADGKSTISYIYKNNEQMCVVNAKQQANYQHTPLPAIAIPVSEGDIIYLKCQVAAEGAVIKNYHSGTFLNIVAIG